MYTYKMVSKCIGYDQQSITITAKRTNRTLVSVCYWERASPSPWCCLEAASRHATAMAVVHRQILSVELGLKLDHKSCSLGEQHGTVSVNRRRHWILECVDLAALPARDMNERPGRGSSDVFPSECSYGSCPEPPDVSQASDLDMSSDIDVCIPTTPAGLNLLLGSEDHGLALN